MGRHRRRVRSRAARREALNGRQPPEVRAGRLAADALAGAAGGRVASAHARAVNLVLDDGPLLVLLPAGTPIHPWALAVALDDAALAPEAEARLSAGVLTVGLTRIVLDRMEVVELRLVTRPPRLPADAEPRLSHLAGTQARAHPLDLPITGALERFRRGGPAGELASIVGCGEGLTPSGDDALVGVLAAFDLARDAVPAASLLRATLAASLASGIERRTSRLSAQMLRAATAGLYAEPVLRLLEALTGAGRASMSLEAAAAALLAVGHRSGGDTLRGFVAGLGRLEAAGSPWWCGPRV